MVRAPDLDANRVGVADTVEERRLVLYAVSVRREVERCYENVGVLERDGHSNDVVVLAPLGDVVAYVEDEIERVLTFDPARIPCCKDALGISRRDRVHLFGGNQQAGDGIVEAELDRPWGPTPAHRHW